ncbi:hypothetical protein M0D21_14715 [Aquimarina sp. D1M17]|uniref:hypothetical protein n=1 Tax=Aquimarina acroporae TaxID=2937283 RepID=UPI0020BD640F|nr:hypothetical protein [Aquimarina acroporae]MCK8522828.1 hypothetical protein [Aquimarina acroporae]
MKDLKKLGTPISREQQKDIKGGAKRIPIGIGIDDECMFPLAPPPPGCNWHLDMEACTARLICLDLIELR